jgi:thiamine-phosphate pyrophosphorylase
MASAERCRLYLISPPEIPDLAAFRKALGEAFSGGDVACFQLRLKGATEEQIRAAAAVLMPVCRHHEVLFVLNDRAELAADIGADGVHLGQEDGNLKQARALLGEEAVIGVSCMDSRHLAMEAGERGADYVSFGAFYPTTTKEAKGKPEPEILRWWNEFFTVPCVAIGGINAENCGALVQAGADFIAVVSAVWHHPHGPKAAVEELNRAIDAATPAKLRRA